MKNLLVYIYVMLVIMVSGNPAIDVIGSDQMTLITFGLGAGLFMTRYQIVTVNNLLFILCVGFLLLVQIALFGPLVFNASVNFVVQLLIAAMLMAVLPKFLTVFVHCMVFISLIALPIYFFIWLPGKEELLRPFALYSNNLEFHIGLYNFRGYVGESGRNSGLFWEPGAFAGYLALALFAMVLLREQNKQSFWLAAILVLALLTTLSTMGYVALLAVAFAYLWQRFRNTHFIYILFGFPLLSVTLVLGAQYAYTEIPFLQQKVQNQLDDVESNADGSEINRFGNAEYDLQFILQRPFFGWSANVDTRIAEDHLARDAIQAQGNALTGTAVRFGFIGWFLLMGRFVYGLYRASQSKVIAITGFALICIMLSLIHI